MANFPLEWRQADVDRYADLVGGFLLGRPGLPYCDECLAHEIGVATEWARAGAWRLWEARGFGRSYRWCARCVRRTVVTEAPFPGRPRA